MKKNIFYLGMIAIALTAASCSNDDNDPETMPEGTADVTINETDANYADYSDHWCSYAAAVSYLLQEDAAALYEAWDVSFDGGEAFKETFTNPGEGKTYTSPNSCIEQIIDGCIDIANEVGESKIGDPRDKWEQGKYTEAVYAVESWYSFHSIQDYSNNIRSIQNAFNCKYGEATGSHSIANYLLNHGETELASNVNSRITAAINAIEGMAAPFRSHIGSPSVLTAIDACNSLKEILKTLKAKIEDFEEEEELKAIVADYVNVVVLPTYNDLKEANASLNTAVRALADQPSNANFKAAAQAWMTARQPWEMSEAFLFGPVDKLGLDPNMDSWPLDQDAIKNVLKKGDYSGLNWKDDDSDEKIEAAQNIRGFHTLEFLLFKDGQPRAIE